VITGECVGLDGHRVEVPSLGCLLEVAGDAGDGAAGADAGHQDVHVAAGVVPDLGPGGALVDGGVGGVLELRMST
jgi:hypothetical protein